MEKFKIKLVEIIKSQWFESSFYFSLACLIIGAVIFFMNK